MRKNLLGGLKQLKMPWRLLDTNPAACLCSFFPASKGGITETGREGKLGAYRQTDRELDSGMRLAGRQAKHPSLRLRERHFRPWSILDCLTLHGGGGGGELGNRSQSVFAFP